MKHHLPYFSEKKMVGAGSDPFYLKLWVKLAQLERKRRFLIDIRSYRISRNI